MKQVVIFVFVLMSWSAIGQTSGGGEVYQFMTLPNSARVTALGGSLISVKDDDGALSFQNPGILNDAMSNQISFSQSFYLAGINYGSASVTKKLGALNYFTGIQYINYGDFQQTDETGFVTGQFDAKEMAVLAGAGYQYSNTLSFGATAKYINSRFETYNSHGLAADLGAVYADTAKKLSIGFVVKNLGEQIKTYTPDNEETLPFDVQLAISKQLKYLPFRYTFTFHNLHRWDITYNDPNADDATTLFGEELTEPSSLGQFADNLARHMIFSGEFLLGRKQNLRLRFAYNHLRRRELLVDNTLGMMGFSLGFGLKVNRFRIDYGRGSYHLADGNSHLTISTNLSEFKSKKKVSF
jgi:hypothetical protein